MSNPTNYGNQVISVKFNAQANSSAFNRMNLNIRPVGIFKGGRLTKISNTVVDLSVLSCEINDGSYQVKVDTQEVVSVTVSTTNLYVILRWVYSAVAANYMEVLAIPLASIEITDIVVGKCVFSGATLTGFDYALRTYPKAYSPLFLKVIPTETPSMRVLVLPGVVNYGSAKLQVVDQQTSLITAPSSNPRIDVIYIDSDGAVKIFTGTEGASPSAPNYQGKIVLAEIYLIPAQTTIDSEDITDVRSFLVPTSGSGIPIQTDWPVLSLRNSSPYQSIPADGSPTIVEFASVEIDSISGWNPTTKRWTPNVAGYYEVFFHMNLTVSSAQVPAHFYSFIYKNGVGESDGSNQIQSAYASSVEFTSPVRSIIYMNGTTDYIDFRAFQHNAAGTSMPTNGNGHAGAKLINRLS